MGFSKLKQVLWCWRVNLLAVSPAQIERQSWCSVVGGSDFRAEGKACSSPGQVTFQKSSTSVEMLLDTSMKRVGTVVPHTVRITS